jgi:hypothetical protein
MVQHQSAESKLKIASWAVAGLLTIVGGAAIGSSFARSGPEASPAAQATPSTTNTAPTVSSAPATIPTTTTLSSPVAPPPSTVTPPSPGSQGTKGVQLSGHAERSHHHHHARGPDG